MIADLLVERKTISFEACLAQIFFVHLFTGSEMVLLVSMAYDRYVAICKPLHYMTIMSRCVCITLVLIPCGVEVAMKERVESHQMDENQTEVVREFVLAGFSQTPSIEAGLFVLFLLFYVSTWVGNVLIMVTVASDNYLNSSPMYFLLGNLSFLDLCYSTVTTPKLLADFLDNEKLIPYDLCIVQLFFLHFVGAAEMFLLTVMAYDRYVAICRPLHYTTIMSRGLCCVLVAASWMGGFVHSTVQTILTIRLPFCGPNQVDNFFCDVPPVIKLACADTFVIELLMVSNSGLISTSSFVVLVSSYTTILVKIRSKEGRLKALSTCGSHLMVVTLFFGPCIFIYARPFSTFSVDKMVSVLYNVITPMLNPLIYTLRNKEVKSAMRKLWDKSGLTWKKQET
ncbi:Olfactory receptor 4Q2 [Camelus dromedarius]|uniref:Olfactory receptor n=2 Tax=Camelus dromedarius TaxID=9838 RepID=A0A5N4E2L5_CAMDR|nr:Olfactory receptor 4Q2 [Camelus dromedarius]